ncbi:MAG: nucleotide exchange factor GrpE [Chthonomonadales bacterium]|nr:nucleotide exchange factor GrpE [Chthonomonadales bacterium]
MTQAQEHEQNAEATVAPADTGAQPEEPGDARPVEDTEGSQIEDRIAQLEHELEEERARALRVLADFKNYRRRNEEQRGDIVRFALQEFVTDSLPVLDNLERALDAAQDAGSFERLHEGVELTRKQVLDLLQRHGVEQIPAQGEPFDPNVHEAVMRVEDAEAPENTVVEEVRRGYCMHGRVIRPAMVKVAARS